MVKPCAKRQMATYLKIQYAASIQLICKTIGIARSSWYYQSQKDDGEVEAKLRELAEQLPNRGFDNYYRRIRLQGYKWIRKRVLRVYRKLGLVRRRKVKRRLPQRVKVPLIEPNQLNETYSMDFMEDRLEDGRKLRVLNIIDDYNREALVCEGAMSFPSKRVIRTLNRLRNERGCWPKNIRLDNGPEYIAQALQDFCKLNKIELLYIQPGKPTQNAYIERFNRHFREDVLDAYLFESYQQFNLIAEKFRVDFNWKHPHEGNGGLPPKVFALENQSKQIRPDRAESASLQLINSL